jgi:hypothetical protein
MCRGSGPPQHRSAPRMREKQKADSSWGGADGGRGTTREIEMTHVSTVLQCLSPGHQTGDTTSPATCSGLPESRLRPRKTNCRHTRPAHPNWLAALPRFHGRPHPRDTHSSSGNTPCWLRVVTTQACPDQNPQEIDVSANSVDLGRNCTRSRISTRGRHFNTTVTQ